MILDPFFFPPFLFFGRWRRFLLLVDGVELAAGMSVTFVGPPWLSDGTCTLGLAFRATLAGISAMCGSGCFLDASASLLPCRFLICDGINWNDDVCWATMVNRIPLRTVLSIMRKQKKSERQVSHHSSDLQIGAKRTSNSLDHVAI